MGVLTPHIQDDNTDSFLQFDVEDRNVPLNHTVKFRDRSTVRITWGSVNFRQFSLKFVGTPAGIETLAAFLASRRGNFFYFDQPLTGDTDIKVAMVNDDDPLVAMYESPGNATLEVEIEEIP